MEPIIVPRSDHPISRKSIDSDAVKVLYRLHRAGYQVYLVGGGVRDLLLGRNPKDFDISTDAHPQQVKRLFRNCRLIGRRFRLAHVHFGGKIVEVSTFRKRSEPVPEDAPADGEDEDILIRSDNTFGTAEEDALRRDFTINGLFYDIGTFAVIDYVAGLDDLKSRTIRTIGDPDIRFREDPVRMIRAIKFAARLDFEIEPATWQAILDNHDEILKSAPPRVLEEIYRLLGGGAAERSFHLLQQCGLLDILAPQLTEFLGEMPNSPMSRWLTALDKLRNEDAPLTNALLVGALIGPIAFDKSDAALNVKQSRGPEDEGHGEDSGGFAGEDEFYVSGETEDRIGDVLGTLGVPRRDTERLFQTFRAMRRFSGQRNRRFSPRSFVTKNYFPEAFLFLHLVIEATGRSEDILTRWRKLAEEAGLDGTIPTGTRRRRRRRRQPGDDAQATIDESGSIMDGHEPEFENEPEQAIEAAPALQSTQPTAPPQPPVRRVDEDDEDSQIRFLGWSDQPEILRNRTEPAPIVNPYTRQAAGGAHRGGGFRRHENGPRHSGGGYSGGGPRHGSGPRSPDGAPRSGGPRQPGEAPRHGGGQSGSRGSYGGPARGSGPDSGPRGAGPGRGNWGAGSGQGRGGYSGGSGRPPGSGPSGPGRSGGQNPPGAPGSPGGQGSPAGPSGRRPRRRQRRREG